MNETKSDEWIDLVAKILVVAFIIAVVLLMTALMIWTGGITF